MIYDRVKGTIVGMAVGCALGLPGASETRARILEMFGENGITDLFPYPSIPEGTKEPSCRIPLKIIEVLVSHSNLDVDGIEEKLKYALRGTVENDRTIGPILGIPVGLYFYREDDPLARLSVRIGAMIGKTEPSMASVLASAYSVSLSLKGYTLYEIVEGGASMFYEIHRPETGCLARVFDLMEKDVDEVEATLGTSKSHETVLARSFYAFLKFNTSFEDAVRASVNMSGPSDVQGGFTGALMGSLKGFKAIPEKWSERLENRDLLESLSKSTYRVILRKQVEC